MFNSDLYKIHQIIHGKTVEHPSVTSRKFKKKGLDLEFHLCGNLKMQICWQKTFHFFHVCTKLMIYSIVNPAS